MLMLSGCAATAAPMPDSAAERVEQIELESNGVTLVGTLEVPALASGEQVPLVLLFHGYQSGRNEHHLVRTAEELLAAGVASLRVDFTGHGFSEGDVGSLASAAEVGLDDARVIARYARELPFVDSLHVVGYSLGGLIATALTGDDPEAIESLVLLAPAPPYGIRLSVWDAAAEFAGDVTIVQGESDELVPVSTAREYERAFDDAELILLPHENHAFTWGTDVASITVDALLQSIRAEAMPLDVGESLPRR